MKKFSFTADTLQEGKRLDTVLAEKYGKFSRAQWVDQIKSSSVMIGSKVAKPSDKLKLGSAIRGSYPTQPEEYNLIAPSTVPEVLYKDQNVIVINKPAELVVHPTGKLSQPSVAAAFASEIEDADTLRPGIVHRLDKDTSGVMILARNTSTKEFLQSQFKNRTVSKTYIALVQGHLEKPSARIELPIERSKKNPEKMTVSSNGKSAISEYDTITEYPGYTLLKIKLLTGRTHQIRAQFAHIGHPIVGDRLYGTQPVPRALSRQFLHAQSLSIEIAPNQKRTFEVPMPKDLQDFLETL